MALYQDAWKYTGEPNRDIHCPVWSYYMLEHLAELMRKQNLVKEVKIGKGEHKLTMYADDVIMYVCMTWVMNYKR